MPAQEYNNSESLRTSTVGCSEDLFLSVPPNVCSLAPLTAVTTTSTKEKRSQPWKTHWPPQKNIPDQKAYGFAKGETVAIYGN
ncbi:hypothetical protein TSTA_015980 [Talaromyces stipitatus ATCC 10500]|uniref:Uncharacterized protein n=1 Tax=Talaromyces stipitatus (strain ATCC 10500 / CBS 375.48 / QM 6759 / NRRL 1006) TaxID=441959 RepID=B8ME91_TALSN|nr:uncharacterized protein TSTA_015980 [Talaromyces stipitatus ATCC 10500]EED16518.1 hypothetical protein TSTA_015980 [Talaromyces stipitatus ATCC 10500]